MQGNPVSCLSERINIRLNYPKDQEEMLDHEKSVILKKKKHGMHRIMDEGHICK